MAGLKVAIVVLAMGIAAVSLGENHGAEAQLHHVVGGDRGWDPSSDLASWSSDKTFMVGDSIWLAYSAAHGYIAEVKSKEEFESCDVTNPIRMFTDGMDRITMDQEGLHYFASSNLDSCKSGLKLHVEVVPHSDQRTEMPKPKKEESMGSLDVADGMGSLVVADGPTTPSGSAHLTGSLMLLSFGLLFYVVNV